MFGLELQTANGMCDAYVSATPVSYFLIMLSFRRLFSLIDLVLTSMPSDINFRSSCYIALYNGVVLLVSWMLVASSKLKKLISTKPI